MKTQVEIKIPTLSSHEQLGYKTQTMSIKAPVIEDKLKIDLQNIHNNKWALLKKKTNLIESNNKRQLELSQQQIKKNNIELSLS